MVVETEVEITVLGNVMARVVVRVISEQAVDVNGQKLGHWHDFEVLVVLLQHPRVVVKFPML